MEKFDSELIAMAKAESISREASESFAKMIRRNNWSFRKLASALNTDTATISRAFARGLTLKQLERYSKIVGVTVTIQFDDLRINDKPLQVVVTNNND